MRKSTAPASGGRRSRRATLLRSALKKKDRAEPAVAAELIQVLPKLEEGEISIVTELLG